MEKINKVLLMMIAMTAIMMMAVGIDKGIQAYDRWKWESERLVRYEQARADITDMQITISQLSQDQSALETFLEENSQFFEEDQMENTAGEDAAEFLENPGEERNDSQAESISENDPMDMPENLQGHISGNQQMSISDNVQEDISGNRQMSISGNGQDDISGNFQGNVSGNLQTDISGNGQAGVSENNQSHTSGLQQGEVSGNTLLEKRKIRGSYMETQMQNGIDQRIIAETTLDFSNISIACLGDSITEAANLNSMEDYQQYSYPARLKDLLDAKNVTNLGIGGSSIGRYWADAFVERFTEIPADTDLILVMGGTNDGFCLSEEELGTMEERKANTFVGDLDELMRGLKEKYPDAAIVFVTPLPNVLHDMLRKERDYLLPQSVLANAIRQLAEEYDIPVIDLYNSNILDTHDAAVIYNYMPDGVHCNPAGYSILAEHIAAELIKLYENGQEREEQGTDMPEEETVYTAYADEYREQE